MTVVECEQVQPECGRFAVAQIKSEGIIVVAAVYGIMIVGSHAVIKAGFDVLQLKVAATRSNALYGFFSDFSIIAYTSTFTSRFGVVESDGTLYSTVK